MSTSILHHAFGLKGIHHKGTGYYGDCILIKAGMTDNVIRCPKCSAGKAPANRDLREKFGEMICNRSPVGPVD